MPTERTVPPPPLLTYISFFIPPSILHELYPGQQTTQQASTNTAAPASFPCARHVVLAMVERERQHVIGSQTDEQPEAQTDVVCTVLATILATFAPFLRTNPDLALAFIASIVVDCSLGELEESTHPLGQQELLQVVRPLGRLYPCQPPRPPDDSSSSASRHLQYASGRLCLPPRALSLLTKFCCNIVGTVSGDALVAAALALVALVEPDPADTAAASRTDRKRGRSDQPSVPGRHTWLSLDDAACAAVAAFTHRRESATLSVTLRTSLLHFLHHLPALSPALTQRLGGEYGWAVAVAVDGEREPRALHLALRLAKSVLTPEMGRPSGPSAPHLPEIWEAVAAYYPITFRAPVSARPTDVERANEAKREAERSSLAQLLVDTLVVAPTLRHRLWSLLAERGEHDRLRSECLVTLRDVAVYLETGRDWPKVGEGDDAASVDDAAADGALVDPAVEAMPHLLHLLTGSGTVTGSGEVAAARAVATALQAGLSLGEALPRLTPFVTPLIEAGLADRGSEMDVASLCASLCLSGPAACLLVLRRVATTWMREGRVIGVAAVASASNRVVVNERERIQAARDAGDLNVESLLVAHPLAPYSATAATLATSLVPDAGALLLARELLRVPDLLPTTLSLPLVRTILRSFGSTDEAHDTAAVDVLTTAGDENSVTMEEHVRRVLDEDEGEVAHALLVAAPKATSSRLLATCASVSMAVCLLPRLLDSAQPDFLSLSLAAVGATALASASDRDADRRRSVQGALLSALVEVVASLSTDTLRYLAADISTAATALAGDADVAATLLGSCGGGSGGTDLVAIAVASRVPHVAGEAAAKRLIDSLAAQVVAAPAGEAPDTLCLDALGALVATYPTLVTGDDVSGWVEAGHVEAAATVIRALARAGDRRSTPLAQQTLLAAVTGPADRAVAAARVVTTLLAPVASWEVAVVDSLWTHRLFAAVRGACLPGAGQGAAAPLLALASAVVTVPRAMVEPHAEELSTLLAAALRHVTGAGGAAMDGATARVAVEAAAHLLAAVPAEVALALAEPLASLVRDLAADPTAAETAEAAATLLTRLAPLADTRVAELGPTIVAALGTLLDANRRSTRTAAVAGRSAWLRALHSAGVAARADAPRPRAWQVAREELKG